MAKFHLPSLEEEQLKKWEDRQIFRKVLDKPASRGDFVFFEGPPTANGKPGIHHVLARSFKDVVLRYRTMRGYNIDRKAGWDTHGLPVELEVEKQLGFTKKQDIEEFGIAEFNEKCKESVWKYLDLWQKLTKRTAFWVDLDAPYITYKNEYVESLWWVLKKIWDRDLLNKGYRVAPHCPRCVTSLSSHELAQGYKEIDDQSIFVKFPIDQEAKRYFLVWTTTPWTLPGNVALAVGGDIDYVEIKLKQGGERLILAKVLLSAVEEEYEIVDEMKGRDLTGIPYQALYATLDEPDETRAARAYKPYLADFVSTADGTGIVHIAPAFGEDDARLGEAEELPTLFTVNDTGTVTAAVPGQGKFIKDADADIKADLKERGLLYREDSYRHTYPFCWRCGTPLLYLAKSSWYIRMSQLRDQLQARNQEINWVPDHIKEGRFGEWLKEVKDWALSRERYWGTPLPVWECPAGHYQAIGGLDELKEAAPEPNVCYLVRHGLAENNAQNTLSSYPEKQEWHLTADGRQRVEQTAQELKDKGVDLVFSSDLLRTKETAEIIAKACGAEVVYDERLREIDVGVFNGRPIAEYHAIFSSRLDKFHKAPEGGEELGTCRRRVVDFLKDLRQNYRGRKIAVVGHGDPLWVGACGWRGLSDEEAIQADYPKKGEYQELVLDHGPRDRDGRIDVHRPYIDEIRIGCQKCGGETMMVRATDVLDCWFDSGAMPYAQWHYPFENVTRIEGDPTTGKPPTNYPADYISEAIDQTRGWFYTLLAVAVALDKKEPPYRNVICLGHILDAKGQKMSKSKGNVVDPWEMIDKYGADAIRWHLFTINQPGDAKCFDEKSLAEVTKKVFLILWNVLSFWQMYAGEGTQAPAELEVESADPLDRWILARLAKLSQDTTAGFDAYDVVGTCRGIGDFINDLSTWYLRRSRDRFKSGSEEEKTMAVKVLGHVLLQLSKLMAPYAPFLADALYQELGGAGESVHLEGWPELAFDAEGDSGRLLGRMEKVRQAASLGLEQRAAAGMPVRQVLAAATVIDSAEFEDWMKRLLADELNVEEVRSEATKGANLAVALDTELTPELRKKGAYRELVRHVNDLRKGARLTIGDKVVLTWQSDSGFWKEVMAEAGERLATDVLADRLAEGRVETEHYKEIQSDDHKIWLGIVKV